MCVLMQLAEISAPTWDDRAAVIRLPRDTDIEESIILARAILLQLGIPQLPESTMKVRCFCGEPARLPAVPVQRSRVEVPRGA